MNGTRQDDLIAAICISTFESTSTSAFRKEVKRYLARALSANQSNDNGDEIHRYIPHNLAHDLFQWIDWKNLILNHNLVTSTSNNGTAFRELIQVLLDPRTVPFALSASLLQVFVRAFISHTRTKEQRRTGVDIENRLLPAQRLLLKAIKRLMARSQCRDDLGVIILSVMRKNASLSVAQSALALIKFCVKELECIRSEFCPVAAMFPCLLGLIHEVMTTLEGAIVPRTTCTCTGMQAPTTKKRCRRERFDLTALHDESGDLGYRPQKFRTNQLSQHMSLKSIVQAKDCKMRCPHCQAPLPESSKGAPLVDGHIWSQLRDRCIHTMCKVFQCTRDISKERAFRVLRAALSADCKSAYIRICVLQSAEMGGPDCYMHLLNLLFTSAKEKQPTYLRWYAEAIVESSFCDDQLRCWKAIEPLIKSVRTSCREEDIEGEPPTQILLPCLGYILACRRFSLETVHESIRQEFIFLRNELASSFSDLDLWIADYDSMVGTDEQIIATLQRLEILSATSLLLGDSHFANEEQKPPAQLRTWVNPKPGELQQAHQRMDWLPLGVTRFDTGNHTLSSKLLSEHQQSQVPAGVNVSEAAKGTNNVVPNVPMMSCLPRELLQSIFAFCGYKKLVRIRPVCTVWRDIAEEDTLWKGLYGKRYGMLSGSCIDEVVGWKRHFVEKWLAGRNIRFKKNRKTGFKYRICGYIQCYRVLRSPEDAIQHLDLHKKRAQKKQEMEMKRKAKNKKQPSACLCTSTAMADPDNKATKRRRDDTDSGFSGRK